ncbi:MAG: TIGR00730 family Rossman fold protein [Deltaproteobacteria bacterium]|nr:MAG: TIGR00730 family Rossman fold protein [Deltaproteobacteria bacterium]
MTRTIERIAVYCGSSNGVHPRYRLAANQLGQALARRGIGLVYGGGDVGLMGEAARGALSAGGEVIGVITEQLMSLELGRLDLSELHIVRTMHERKLLMTELSSAFVALPGGYGTLDELFEAVTWSQLNVHRKPCALFNVHGYFDRLIAFLDHAAAEGFVRGPHRALLPAFDTVPGLIDGLEQAEVPEFGDWVVQP